MNKKTPAELTNEELLKQEKMARLAVYLLISASVIMLISGIILSIKKGFSTFTILPVAFLPLIILNTKSLKEIVAEKKIRNL